MIDTRLKGGLYTPLCIPRGSARNTRTPHGIRGLRADCVRNPRGLLIPRMAGIHAILVRADSHGSARNSADSTLFARIPRNSAVRVREFRVIIDIIIDY
jgi:hypothetical protein